MFLMYFALHQLFCILKTFKCTSNQLKIKNLTKLNIKLNPKLNSKCCGQRARRKEDLFWELCLNFCSKAKRLRGWDWKSWKDGRGVYFQRANIRGNSHVGRRKVATLENKWMVIMVACGFKHNRHPKYTLIFYTKLNKNKSVL